MTRWAPKYWCFCKACGWRGKRTELQANLRCPKCELTGSKYTDGRVEYQVNNPTQAYLIPPNRKTKK